MQAISCLPGGKSLTHTPSSRAQVISRTCSRGRDTRDGLYAYFNFTVFLLFERMPTAILNNWKSGLPFLSRVSLKYLISPYVRDVHCMPKKKKKNKQTISDTMFSRATSSFLKYLVQWWLLMAFDAPAFNKKTYDVWFTDSFRSFAE